MVLLLTFYSPKYFHITLRYPKSQHIFFPGDKQKHHLIRPAVSSSPTPNHSAYYGTNTCLLYSSHHTHFYLLTAGVLSEAEPIMENPNLCLLHSFSYDNRVNKKCILTDNQYKCAHPKNLP